LISALRTGIRYASRKGWFLQSWEELTNEDIYEQTMREAFGEGFVSQMMWQKSGEWDRYVSSWF
jgi:hypothetical protein